jgi:hypothetical protein
MNSRSPATISGSAGEPNKQRSSCLAANGLSEHGGDDVRGQSVTIPLDTHDWCPGTYKISVAYVGQTPRNAAYPPFGTTTLTVG